MFTKLNNYESISQNDEPDHNINSSNDGLNHTINSLELGNDINDNSEDNLNNLENDNKIKICEKNKQLMVIHFIDGVWNFSINMLCFTYALGKFITVNLVLNQYVFNFICKYSLIIFFGAICFAFALRRISNKVVKNNVFKSDNFNQNIILGFFLTYSLILIPFLCLEANNLFQPIFYAEYFNFFIFTICCSIFSYICNNIPINLFHIIVEKNICDESNGSNDRSNGSNDYYNSLNICDKIIYKIIKFSAYGPLKQFKNNQISLNNILLSSNIIILFLLVVFSMVYIFIGVINTDLHIEYFIEISILTIVFFEISMCAGKNITSMYDDMYLKQNKKLLSYAKSKLINVVISIGINSMLLTNIYSNDYKKEKTIIFVFA